MNIFFKKIKPWWPLLLLIVCGLLIGRTLFSAKLAVTHDLEIHAARTANYYLALKQGQIPPRWAPNLNYGFGYPVFNFFYHTSYFVAAIFFSLTNSIELSLNLFIFFFLLVAGIGVYLLSFFKTKKHFPSLIIALTYITTPYFLLDIFVRGAVGEIAFLATTVWVILFIHLRKHSRSWWYLLLFPIILVAWFLSQHVLVMITFPILAVWLIVDELSQKKSQRLNTSVWVYFFSIGFVSLLMVVWSWIPILAEKQLIVVGQNNYMEKNYDQQFPEFSRLLWSNWEYSGLVDSSEDGRFTQMISPFGWFVFCLSLLFFFDQSLQKKQSKNYRLLYWTIAFLLAIFLMNKSSLFIWEFLAPMQNLQFPWRFLFLSMLAATMLLIEIWPFLNKKIQIFFSVVVMIWTFYLSFFWAKPVATFHKPIEQWLEYHLSGDSFGELRPLWFELGENLKDFDKLYFQNFTGNLTKVEPINLVWTGTKISYDFESLADGAVIQKTMYYPGWQAKVNGKLVEIDYQQASFSGRIIYPVNKGSNRVEVFFSDQDTYRFFLNLISLTAVASWLVIVLVSFLTQMSGRK